MGSLKQLAEDLGKAADELDDEARKLVSKGALNVKTEARELITGRAHLPHYPNSITYDITAMTYAVSAIIGPERDLLQGKLGDIIEDGSIHNAPIPHLAPAADNEEPRMEHAAGDLGEKLLGER